MKPAAAIRKFLRDHPDKMIVNKAYVLELKEQISELQAEATPPICHPELHLDLYLFGAHYHTTDGKRLDPTKVAIAVPKRISPPAGF